jgi:hypothetical protein
MMNAAAGQEPASSMRKATAGVVSSGMAKKCVFLDKKAPLTHKRSTTPRSQVHPINLADDLVSHSADGRANAISLQVSFETCLAAEMTLKKVGT